MTEADIKSTYISICHLLENNQLKEALEKLQSFSQSLHLWEITEKLNELQENYRMMLNYAFEDVKDPQQKKLYYSLIAKAYKIGDEVKEELLFRNSHSFIYTQKRYLPYTKSFTASELVLELETVQSGANLSELVEESLNAPGRNKEYALQNDKLSKQLFNILWLAGTYTNEESNLYNNVLASNLVSISDKCLAVSAVTLSSLRYFHEEKILLLIETANHPDDAISQRALVGLLPVLAHYDKRLPYFPTIRNRLVLLVDNPKVAQHITHIILQFARTNETAKISKKLQEEILPEMMKVAPKLKEKIDLEALMKNDDSEEKNPEWQEMLENSGIADKLREFTELQMEGSDVYMSTFAMLKSFPFFNDTCHWFKPFDSNQADIIDLFAGEDQALLSSMVHNGYMCNSDRYSFCLSLMQMPAAQRNLMSKAFTMEADQLKEIQKEDAVLSATKRAEVISNAYIQDMYRFFNLYPQRDDFENAFEKSLKFHQCGFFSLLGYDLEALRHIGEYYFFKDFYAEALEIFQSIEKKSDTGHDLCQKIGYCYQKTGDYSRALQYYLQAEIILPNEKWTLRKIAYCYRKLKDYKNALDYYLRVEEMLPENKTVLTQIGNCYLSNKQYDEALAYFFKVEYAEPQNNKIWRAIAWSSFLANKTDQAKKYLQKATEEKEEWTDYLNLGHIALLEGHKKEAIAQYEKAFILSDKDFDTFIVNFNRDAMHLKEKGVDETEIHILLDYLRYLMD